MGTISWFDRKDAIVVPSFWSIGTGTSRSRETEAISLSGRLTLAGSIGGGGGGGGGLIVGF